MEFNTPDRAVRRQIEAAKAHLRVEGLSDVEDAPELQRRTFDGRHVIAMTFQGHRRFLWLSYPWLSERSPEAVAQELSERGSRTT